MSQLVTSLYEVMIALSQLGIVDFSAGVNIEQAETKEITLENIDLSSSFQNLPNNGLQTRLSQGKTKFIFLMDLTILMDENLHLKTSDEEYPIMFPRILH